MEYKLYIDGRFCDAAGGGTIGVRDPALGREFARVAYGRGEDAQRAIAAAERSFRLWRDVNVYERAQYLRQVGALMRQRVETMAEAVTREVGKPLAESRAEVLGAAATFEHAAEEAKRHYGEWVLSHVNDKRLLTLRSPIGVCAGIAPWNFPVMLLCRKLGPALAVGCTMVARSASQTPRSAMELFGCIHDAGLPAGVANLVTGPAGEQAQEFLAHPAVRKISFTGSVEVGKELMAAAAKGLKKLSLELGGHAPFIVCPDADLEPAADVAVKAKFRNMGQSCIAPSRFYVPRAKARDFTAMVVRLTSALTIGNGLDPGTRVGPLIDELRVAATEALVEDIKNKGGAILCGGQRPAGDRFKSGSFYEPTVAVDLNQDMLIMKEEPFAPILPIIPYDDLDQAVELANATPFGLAAYAATNDMTTIFKLGERLEAGVIAVNDFAPATPQAPFGGMKESGLGREGGWQVLDAYTEVKLISIAMT